MCDYVACMFVRFFLEMRTFVSLRLLMFRCAYIMYVSICIYIYIYIRIQDYDDAGPASTCAHMHVCICLCMYVCMYV